ncbi:MAG TPA: inorganic phosphate transporter [bacterium]|nr:inorganic phosphate transporter [bacterium]HPQ65738.1 inorganic phosphate transporter [bacterium]
MSYLLIVAIGAVLVFAVTNGMKDGANVFATTVASGALPRSVAIVIVAIAELAGPYLLGTRVAATVSQNIIDPTVIHGGDGTIIMLLSGILGALAWNGLSWYLKLPTSSSLTLVGGLIGPALYRYGLVAVPWGVFSIKIVLVMFLSPVAGLLAGYLICLLFRFLLKGASPRANRPIRKAHFATLIFLGMNHGTNDSQKAMGVIALLLFVAGRNHAIAVPFWVKTACVLALTTGIVTGGTKIIKTVGYGIFKVRPLQSLEAQLGAAGLLLGSNLAGVPVSTTQIISSGIMGVGTGIRAKGVRWNLARTIVWSWILTLPLAGLMGVLIYMLLRSLL